MKQVLFAFLLLFLCKTMHAQEVVATSGASSQTASGGISYTIGEIITETFTASGTTLTQGEQQTRLVITAINVLADLGYTIDAFPNPATDFVKLSVSSENIKGLLYALYDITGKTIFIKQIESAETTIPFSDKRSGSYFLKVFAGKKEVKSFKIIKKF